MERHLWQCLFKPPIYNPEHTRIVTVNGKVSFFLSAKGLFVETSDERIAADSLTGASQKSMPLRRKNVKIPSRWLSGLLTGYYAISDLRLREGVSIPQDLMEPFTRLFPAGWLFVYQGDNY